MIKVLVTGGAYHLKAAPLLTRHAILLMARDQGYSIDKAKREMGFQSTVSFEEGLDRSVGWFRQVL